MPHCKSLKKNQKMICSDCGLEFLVINECKNKDDQECCSKDNPTDCNFTCCGKKMNFKK